jgi:hypothetical protein
VQKNGANISRNAYDFLEKIYSLTEFDLLEGSSKIIEDLLEDTWISASASQESAMSLLNSNNSSVSQKLLIESFLKAIGEKELMKLFEQCVEFKDAA